MILVAYVTSADIVTQQIEQRRAALLDAVGCRDWNPAKEAMVRKIRSTMGLPDRAAQATTVQETIIEAVRNMSPVTLLQVYPGDFELQTAY